MIWLIFSEETYNLDKVIKHLTNPIIVTNNEQIIVGVNDYWIQMCKYNLDDLYKLIPRLTPKILHGEFTNTKITSAFRDTLVNENCAFGDFINYTKFGDMFVNHVFAWRCGDLYVCETYDTTKYSTTWSLRNQPLET
tara:strand:- start:1 stop:411 length:411 start_codon:yes stop_codon:yes gene_type:complete